MNNFMVGLRRRSLLAIAGLMMMTILARRFLRAGVETLIGMATSQMMNEIITEDNEASEYERSSERGKHA